MSNRHDRSNSFYALMLAAMFAACNDGSAPQYAGWTEAGVPIHRTEAGLVFYTEAGAVQITEAGPVPITEAGPVPITEAGPVPGTEAGAGPIADSGPWVCEKITCLGKSTACGDCQDNDGDGKIDVQDPECLGPCDDTEGPALISGVGGVTGSTCHVDCYFDYGNGMGNDACWWDHQCDPLEPEAPTCTYDANMVGKKFCPQPQAQGCTDYCLPLTPNGCDCFGCCTFPDLAGKGDNNEDAFVWIGAKDDANAGTCTFASILDPAKCPRCTPVPGCYNPCGRCELCMGKTTLPADCYTSPGPTDGGAAGDGAAATDAGTTTDAAVVPPSLQCPGGEQPCGLPGQAPCSTGYYCISGCCILTIQ